MRKSALGHLLVIRSHSFGVAAVALLIALAPVCAHAQWWRSAPADFEECADKAEKAATKEEKTSALAECNAKFAGRRKPGGGYTYYDFMQDRTFDIAGPNPTPDEQKHIDQQYTVYLEKQRRNSITAALMAKQQPPQAEPVQQASLRTDPPTRSETVTRTETVRVPVPVASPLKPQAAGNDGKPSRAKPNCVKGSFSCEWPRLSDSINDLKKLFGAAPPAKDKDRPKRG